MAAKKIGAHGSSAKDSQSRSAKADPKAKGATPPFPEQEQQPPGTTRAMEPRPDHGEDSYRGCGRLEGKVALVTGADSGIGRAVALAFAREGADLLVAYLSEHEDARETKRLVEEAGRRCVLVAGDVSEARHCRSLVQRAMDEFGRIDVLVNNAAHQRIFETLDEMPDEEIDRHFRTNVYALIHLVKAAVPHMKPGSAIINTASIESYHPQPFLMVYAATKGAIANLTMSLAQLLAKQGIRVNAVAPGPIWTPLIPMSFPGENVKTFGKDTPLGRPGQPKELAPIYVLLASEEASYVTGMIYGATGGKPLF
jgi:NAD(P)-dependent dehydrogenase (short-subunit alcohol dehydrogenase family)